MGFFRECVKAGEGIISFAQEGKVNIVLVVIACFISPVNLIMWSLILCALYQRGKKQSKGKK